MKSKLLMLIILTLVIYNIIAEEPEPTSFKIYKAVNTGYGSLRVSAIFMAPYLYEGELKHSIYNFYSNECHQLSERSFHLNNNSLPVCARCTGINLGYTAGQWAYYFLNQENRNILYSPEKYWKKIALISLGIIPLAIDGTFQYKTSYESNNSLRLSTGILYGMSISLIFDITVNNFIHIITKDKPKIK